MDAFLVHFSVSGVETWGFVPPLVALLISACTSPGGVSGAFLLLPFQMSVLGFTGPAVSSTNLVFNIVATPGGVYRILREGRMAWPLAWTVAAGTLPGIVLGFFLRVRCLPDPRAFRFFAGLVLLGVGLRLLADTTARARARSAEAAELERKFADQVRKERTRTGAALASGLPPQATVRNVSISAREIAYDFWEERCRFSVPGMLALSFAVGIIGGTYGIGGGAIIAPFCVALFRLPIHTVAGAALFATFLTSVAGVVVYTFLPAPGGLSTRPDWALGALFGAGGFAGVYIGARLQRYLPPTALKRMLGIMIVALAAGYLF